MGEVNRRDPLSLGEHYATIRGVKLWYHVKGQGSPLLFQPGGAGWGGDITPYIATLSPLEKVRRVIYLEPRGMGRSQRLTDPTAYKMEAYVEDIEALRRYFGLSKLAIAGHSHGGFVTLKYAIKYPRYVERLLLLGTSPFLGLGDFDSWLRNRTGYSEAQIKYERLDKSTLTLDELRKASLEIWVPVWHFTDYEKGLDFVDKYISRMVASGAPRKYFLENEWTSYDIRGELSHIDAPAMIVTGDDDVLPLVLGSRLLHIELQNSELVVIPHCGHFHWIEQPEAFFEAVICFLQDQ